jgi:8-oxo-dGTP diphosphatase
MSPRGLTALARWGFGRGPRPPRTEPALKVRVSVVVLRGERILLTRHRRDARFYWVLPGGGLETGEDLATCAAREVREETGLDAKILRLLYVGEVLSPSRKQHVLNLIFLGEVEPDQPLRPSRHWQIEEPHFIPLEDLASIEFYPPIAIEILEDAEAKWQGPIRLLGNLWRNMDETPEWRSPD